MSITINIYYSGKGARQFAEEMIKSGVADMVRAEEGNERYDYFLPLGGEDAVLLIDSWASQAALDKHHNSPLMGEIARLREKYDVHMRVERFVSEVGNKDDEKYIRR